MLEARNDDGFTGFWAGSIAPAPPPTPHPLEGRGSSLYSLEGEIEVHLFKRYLDYTRLEHVVAAREKCFMDE